MRQFASMVNTTALLNKAAQSFRNRHSSIFDAPSLLGNILECLVDVWGDEFSAWISWKLAMLLHDICPTFIPMKISCIIKQWTIINREDSWTVKCDRSIFELEKLLKVWFISRRTLQNVDERTLVKRVFQSQNCYKTTWLNINRAWGLVE